MHRRSTSSSLQAILKRRLQQDFIGRQREEDLFRQNLALSPDDERRQFIFNIFGQGGVGKTSLLHRFCKLAEDSGAKCAWTDENEEDMPAVLMRIADQLEQHCEAFKTFTERSRLYCQLRHQLATDPEAPQGFPAFISRTLTKAGFQLGRNIPIGGVVFDFIDQETVASQLSNWATYVTRKLTNKDEVRLLQEPMKVLTPLFLEGMQKIAEKQELALFIDTYERTNKYLDDWLYALLEGQFGDLPPNVVFAIAGREELDRNRWVSYNGVITRLCLEPFTEAEAYDYLVRKNIKDPDIAAVILNLSGRLPLLVAMLANEHPYEIKHVVDPSETAIDRFLKWVEDPIRRQIALDAALPRKLNRDVLAETAGANTDEALFAWLVRLPFVEKQRGGWKYHEVVRTQMLRYKHSESIQKWVSLHERLASYYEKQRDDLGLTASQGRRNTTWQSFTLEALYHRLCHHHTPFWVKHSMGFSQRFEYKEHFYIVGQRLFYRQEKTVKL